MFDATPVAEAMECDNMIELSHVTKKYVGKQALCDVSLTLPCGEIVGLLGENGAGKTTLMKCILGFVRFEGTITLDGEPITHRNIASLSFGTSEHSFFPGLTAQAHREFYEAHFPCFSAQRFHGLMDFFHLPLHQPLRAFSTGQKNQFEVILALSQGADYILLDEPFAALDALSAFAGTPIPAPLDALRAREERFRAVVNKDEMRESVKKWLVK